MRSIAVRLAALTMATAFAAVLAGCGGDEDKASSGSESARIAAAVSRQERASSASARKPFCAPRSIMATEGEDRPGLLLWKSEVKLGEGLLARVSNPRDEALYHGLTPEVAQLIQGRWQKREFIRQGREFDFRDLDVELPPEMLSGCLKVPPSDTWRPGLYRVRFNVESIGTPGHPEDLSPVAFFRIDKSRIPS